MLCQAQSLLREGASQEAILGFIQSTADFHGIRMRREANAPSIVPAPASSPLAGPSDQNATPPVAGPSDPIAEPALVDSGPSSAGAALAGCEPSLSVGIEPSSADAGPADAGPTDAGSAVPGQADIDTPDACPACPEPGPGSLPGGPAPKKSRKKRGGRKKTNLPVKVVRLDDGSHLLSIRVAAESPAGEPGPEGPRGAAAPEAVFEEEEPPVRRVILSSGERAGRQRGAKGAILQHECNGLVLDATTWRALSVPPGAFHLSPGAAALDPLLAQGLYDIIRADDGTVLTIYHWTPPGLGPAGQWCLASSNGYDVSTLRWCGDRTFASILFDLATRHYPGFVESAGVTLDESGRLRFERLDPSRCYTVGLRHHDFHPVLADPERLWLIQVTDLGGPLPRPAALKLSGLPTQEVFANPHLLAALAGSRRAQAPESPDGWPTLADLVLLGSDSLEKAAAFIGKEAGPSQASEATPDRRLPAELHYGFILRSRDPSRTQALSDILVESPLLARVRKLLYDRAPRALQDSVSADIRSEYAAMRAFLTVDDRTAFLDLCPQWGDRFRAFDEFTRSVIGLVAHSLRQRAMGPASREPALRSPIGQVAKALVEHIWASEKHLSAFHSDAESIIRDYVISPEYALMYLRALKLTPPDAPPGGGPGAEGPPDG